MDHGIDATPITGTKSDSFGGKLDRDVPACCEIGTGGPCGGRLQWDYVGERAVREQAPAGGDWKEDPAAQPRERGGDELGE